MKTKVALLSALFMFLSVGRVSAGECVNVYGGQGGYCTCSNTYARCVSYGDTAWVFKFVCDGKVPQCGNPSNGGAQPISENSGYNMSLDISGVSCGKTVQLDTFDRNCRVNGWDPNCQLRDYVTWYSGDCGGTTTTTTVNPPSCNTVSISVSPNSVTAGQSLRFSVSGDASTFLSDNFTGGVINYPSSDASRAWGFSGTANGNPGTYTWTRQWKHCEGNFNNCSGVCSASSSFSITRQETYPTPTPTPTPLGASPTPTPTPTPVPGTPNYCGGTCGSNNNCQYGYFCYQGFCRLPSCPTSADCSCGGPTPTPVAVTTPRTGFDAFLPSLILIGLGCTGLWLKRSALSS